MSIPAGFSSDISIKRTFIRKKGGHYSPCSDNLQASNSPFYKQIISMNQTYRQIDCIEMLRQDYVINKCGCTSSFFTQHTSNFNLCITNADGACILKHYFSHDYAKNTSFNEYCPLECETIKYDLKLVSAPLKDVARSLVRRKRFNNSMFGNQTDEEYIASIGRISIYYEDLSYIEIIEIPKYLWISLISNIGGALGLFLGMSILSIFEVIELALSLFLKFFNNRVSENSTKKTEIEQ
jgi:hypothetical protein